MGSGNVLARYNAVSAGLMVLEPALFDDTNLTTSTKFGTVSATSVIAVPGFISDAMGTARTQLVTSFNQNFGWGTPALGILSQARSLTDSTKKHIFSYFPGQLMANNQPAPAPRVAFFATDAAAAQLTTSGRRIFQEAAFLADQ